MSSEVNRVSSARQQTAEQILALLYRATANTSTEGMLMFIAALVLLDNQHISDQSAISGARRLVQMASKKPVQ